MSTPTALLADLSNHALSPAEVCARHALTIDQLAEVMASEPFLRTADAVNPAPGLVWGFILVAVVYAALTVATVYVLRRLARSTPVPTAPQERDVTDYRVT